MRQMLAESANAGERAGSGNPTGTNGGTVDARDSSYAPPLAEIGITRDQSSKWQQLAALPEAKFEEALAMTQAVMQEVSAPKVLRVVQQARARAPEIVADDDVIDAPPPRVLTPDEQAIAFHNAVRDLAALTLNAVELRTALPYYQHRRITDNLARARALLNDVSETWTTYTSTTKARKAGPSAHLAARGRRQS